MAPYSPCGPLQNRPHNLTQNCLKISAPKSVYNWPQSLEIDPKIGSKVSHKLALNHFEICIKSSQNWFKIGTKNWHIIGPQIRLKTGPKISPILATKLA
jgi:hypothetical protein